MNDEKKTLIYNEARLALAQAEFSALLVSSMPVFVHWLGDTKKRERDVPHNRSLSP